MSALSEQQWKEIEESLRSFFCSVCLLIDGYHVTLSLQRESQMKNAIYVYVNGKIRGAWFMRDCEESRRFFPVRERYVFSKKSREAAIAAWGKQRAVEHGYFKTLRSCGMSWHSFASLKRHLIANNESIQVLTPAEVKDHAI